MNDPIEVFDGRQEFFLLLLQLCHLVALLIVDVFKKGIFFPDLVEELLLVVRGTSELRVIVLLTGVGRQTPISGYVLFVWVRVDYFR